MTTGVGPYVVPSAPTDDDPLSTILEATIVTAHTMVDVGGVTAMAETYNGTIPGPTFRLNVGDSLFVRLINTLSHATGIHWHGVEMANHKDGSPFTQNGVPPGGLVPPHGTYLYKLRFPRPGLYWYHPHHHGSTNQVFKGLYGAIIVTDPAEIAGVLPGAADTLPLVLSDMTVCKDAVLGPNDTQTYPSTLPWVGGGALPTQAGPTPATLCELPTALDEEGNPAPATFMEGDIPNIQVLVATPLQPTNEGQTVLTNGMNVGGRAGTPAGPGALDAGGQLPRDVQAGQWLRLQIFNAATIRYFRLLLTTSTGGPVPLLRVGGEGGLLDKPVLEGGGGGAVFDTKYTQGEILLPPGSRAEVVALIPNTEPTDAVLTMWTQDYRRAGMGLGYTNIPTVPVAHFHVTGPFGGTPLIITTATALRSAPVDLLGAPTGTLLNPTTFAKPGLAAQNIQITVGGGHTSFDGVIGDHDPMGLYTGAAHMGSSRYANIGDLLELTVQNTTSAHHPFHLHGFSMQPKSLTHTTQPDLTWPYNEFRDNIDIPAGYTLTFRVHLAARNLVDDASPGGAMGRWMFHCHIFFHAHLGMVSELVVTAADGSEKPNVDVDGSWAYAGTGGTVTRTGTYAHPDGLLPLASLVATDAAGTAVGAIVDNPVAHTWSWSFSGPDQTSYVYVKATDTEGRSDQTVFRFRIGGIDDGADNGDPHIHTVDGKRYDFQAAGEFTLLLDLEDGLEIQARQTPVKVASPVTDPYTGLRSCVCVNTAIAARVGSHRISYQPVHDGKLLQLFIDGKPTQVPPQGIDLGEHRLTTEAVSGGGIAVRVDYANQAVLIITPLFWTTYGVWYMNVSVAHTSADRGVMGRIPSNSWLPALPNGNTVGPMPASLHDRYVALYRTFADAWRVTDKTSLFVYARGTSTKTFTDREWPAERPPCTLLPQFEVPGGTPTLKSMPIEQARQVCSRVTIAGLNQDCVFDVATTGDKLFAAGYELAQELRQRGTAVQIFANEPRSKPGQEVVITAVVLNLYRDARELPSGKVIFFVDGKDAGPAVKLDERSRASMSLRDLKIGEHLIRADYAGAGKGGHQSSSSANLLHVVVREGRQPGRRDPMPHTPKAAATGGRKKRKK